MISSPPLNTSPQDVQLSGSATLKIQILDQNDNVPQFTNIGDTIYVPDSVKRGDIVFQFDAEDKDSGPNSKLQFYLSGSASGQFSLDSSTGSLTARQDLQKDTRLQITVEVFDSGKPALSTRKKLSIEVADARLFPTFTSSISQVNIKEGELTTGKFSLSSTLCSCSCFVCIMKLSHSNLPRSTYAGSQLNQPP